MSVLLAFIVACMGNPFVELIFIKQKTDVEIRRFSSVIEKKRNYSASAFLRVLKHLAQT